MAKRSFGVLLSLAITCACPSAFAAPPASPQVIDVDVPDESEGALADAARASFAEGLRWYKKKNYNQALAAFLQAYALTKNPAVLVNLGQTNLRLGSPLNAVRYFEKFLLEAKDATPSVRSRVEVSLGDARKQIGAIDVSAAEGSEISVDGEVVGRTPLPRPIDVMPGSHEVSMTSPAGSKTEKVDVGRGEKVAIKLVAPRIAPRPSPAPAPKAEGAPPETPGFFSPPSFVAPTYALGAIGLAGLTTAIVLNGIRVNADRNRATATEALVRGQKNPGACFDPGAIASDPTIEGACGTIRESERIAKKTDDMFTASLWTGIGATTAALAWYLLAPKASASVTTGSAAPKVLLAPTFGRGAAGASVSGAF